jgi:hypothetical protein
VNDLFETWLVIRMLLGRTAARVALLCLLAIAGLIVYGLLESAALHYAAKAHRVKSK